MIDRPRSRSTASTRRSTRRPRRPPRISQTTFSRALRGAPKGRDSRERTALCGIASLTSQDTSRGDEGYRSRRRPGSAHRPDNPPSTAPPPTWHSPRSRCGDPKRQRLACGGLSFGRRLARAQDPTRPWEAGERRPDRHVVRLFGRGELLASIVRDGAWVFGSARGNRLPGFAVPVIQRAVVVARQAVGIAGVDAGDGVFPGRYDRADVHGLIEQQRSERFETGVERLADRASVAGRAAAVTEQRRI